MRDEMKIIDDLQATCPHDEKVISRTKIGARWFEISCCRRCGKLDPEPLPLVGKYKADYSGLTKVEQESSDADLEEFYRNSTPRS